MPQIPAVGGGYRIAIMLGIAVLGQVAMRPPSSPPNFSTAATAPTATWRRL